MSMCWRGRGKKEVGFINHEKGEEDGLLILEAVGGERVYLSSVLPPLEIGGKEEEEDETWFKTSHYAKGLWFWGWYAKNI